MGLDRRPNEAPRNDLEGLSLRAYIPRVSPHLQDPFHLSPLTDVLERAPGEGLRVVVACPVQHGKTTCVIHAVPWWLKKNPRLKIIYATYGAKFSQKQSRTMRRIAMDSGIRISADHNTIEEWQTEEGGFLFATSVDGPGTGYGADIAVIDDPFKNREDAESPEYRDKADEWMRDVILTRLAPHASVFVIASRWHDDDLSGRRLKDGYAHVHLRAIDELGRPLAPHMGRDLTFLAEARKAVKEYGWWSLFQGEPKPRGGSIFRAPKYYVTLPDRPLRIAIGCDAQYVEGRDNDDAVAVVLAEEIAPVDGPKLHRPNSNQVFEDRGGARVIQLAPAIARAAALIKEREEALRSIRGRWNNSSGLLKYVVDVRRTNEGIVAVEEMFRQVVTDYPGVPLGSYVAGPELGILQLFATRGLNIMPMPAKWNKRVRAVPTADEWNNDEILVQQGAEWEPVFSKIVVNFTGRDGDRDDDVDGLVSARDLLRSGSIALPGSGFTAGRRCM